VLEAGLGVAGSRANEVFRLLPIAHTRVDPVDEVINTWPLDQLRGFLATGHTTGKLDRARCLSRGRG
jgi:hypothetical protein